MNFPRASFLAIGGIALTAAAVGCGSASTASDSGPGRVLLRVPTAPNQRDCRVADLRTDVGAQNLAPDPGTYSYKVQGTRSLKGGGTNSVKRLPAVVKVIVTPTRDYGKVVCFRVQRRYTAALGDTATFAVRGSDVYLTDLTLQSGGEITVIDPSPPVLSLAGNQVTWSGTFSGETNGQFAGDLVGRRSLPLPNGQKVQAIGIQLRVSFSGQTRGTLNTTQWLSASHNFVLGETLDLNRSFGLDHEHLQFQSHLQSLPSK